MGRKYVDLYEKIWRYDNLWDAYIKAARGKRAQPAVATFEYDLEKELIQLEIELQERTYCPGGYYHFIIQHPKRRLISAAPFRDRVVHHALMNIIEPLFERQFIHDSYANRVGKGTHRALDRCTYFMRRYDYVMHCDIVQFFPSIDHQMLRGILGNTIGDPNVMELISKILNSGVSVQREAYLPVYFPGDDLFAVNRSRGLPIGNLTSQHWANVYLNELDQYIKRSLKCRGYLRYVDDFLLFANQKADLHDWRESIIRFLVKLRLTIHETRAQPRPVQTGVPFLGFLVFPTHRRLKRRNGVSYQRKLRNLTRMYKKREIDLNQLEASLRGWINHARYGDTWGLRKAILASVDLGVEAL